jgi:hypothetical protein
VGDEHPGAGETAPLGLEGERPRDTHTGVVGALDQPELLPHRHQRLGSGRVTTDDPAALAGLREPSLARGTTGNLAQLELGRAGALDLSEHLGYARGQVVRHLRSLGRLTDL